MKISPTEIMLIDLFLDSTGKGVLELSKKAKILIANNSQVR